MFEEETKQLAISMGAIALVVLIVAAAILGDTRSKIECLVQVVQAGLNAQEAKEACK